MKNGTISGVLKKLSAFLESPLGAEIIVLVVYGLLINFLLNSLLSYSFTAFTALAWGLVYYFLAYDLPQIVDKYRKALTK